MIAVRPSVRICGFFSRTEAGRANTTIDTLVILVDFYNAETPLTVSKETSFLYSIEQS